ncbi:hypothetical protein CR513_00607, partial [Mucuna pruriens]
MREHINKMFEIITWNAAPTSAVATQGAAPSTATQGTPTYPPGFVPPARNATTKNPLAPQEQLGRNSFGAGQAQGSRTGPYPTPGEMVYFHPPPESGRVPGPIPEPALMIDVGWLGFKGNEPNISTNPFPTHEGQSINTLSHNTLASDQEEEIAQKISQVAAVGGIPKRQADDLLIEEITNFAKLGGMTRSGRIYTLENLGKKDPKENPKKSFKEKEAEEFLKLIRYSKYELLDHMNKTPVCISLLSLLLHSESHQNLLLKVLNEAHAAPDITAERFGGIVSSFTSNGRLTFSNEEIPIEGRRHNQPLHISVKCGDYMITKVLIDNGSSLNVLPKATLELEDVEWIQRCLDQLNLIKEKCLTTLCHGQLY